MFSLLEFLDSDDTTSESEEQPLEEETAEEIPSGLPSPSLPPSPVFAPSPPIVFDVSVVEDFLPPSLPPEEEREIFQTTIEGEKGQERALVITSEGLKETLLAGGVGASLGLAFGNPALGFMVGVVAHVGKKALRMVL